MNKVIISAKDISIGYKKTAHREGTVLYENLSFVLNAGELTCLLGPNGAGKSTLLRTLTAMQESLKGTVFLYGKPLAEYNVNELSWELGIVLTDKTSVGGFTVSQLVALGRYPYTGFWGRLSAHDYSVINQAMSDVGIIHKAKSYVAELSDGEKQKVMIAKALAQECPIIILDEPTAFLDIVSRIEIMELLHELALTQNKTILLSTHDIESTLLFADRLWLLSRDQGLECGLTEDVLLSDSMSRFLTRDNITFDKQTGSFLPQQSFERRVFLIAEKTLYHWGKNFLRRNGWDVTEDKSNSAFSLRVVSNRELYISDGVNENELSSFDQVQKWIRTKY